MEVRNGKRKIKRSASLKESSPDNEVAVDVLQNPLLKYHMRSLPLVHYKLFADLLHGKVCPMMQRGYLQKGQGQGALSST